VAPLAEALEIGQAIVAGGGPDRDDLAYLRDLEEKQLFASEVTILLLNQALVPAGRLASAAFQPVLDSPNFCAALARGAAPPRPRPRDR
jgi:hypothetical protein